MATKKPFVGEIQFDDETVVLPKLPDFFVGYDETAHYYFPLIVEKNVTGYVNSFVDVTYDAPFGFGEAIVLNKENQCVVKSGYRERHDDCVGNITEANCPRGFSMSIWERVVYGEEVLNVRIEHERKYIFSTGGDFVEDRAYRGVAIYHEGIDLVAVVSTGKDVWHLKVTGQLVNESWSNIGIRWEPQNSLTNEGGLEMYVNAQKVGHTIFPMPRPGFDAATNNLGKWKVVGDPGPIDVMNAAEETFTMNPPYFMVGCHRRSDETKFGYFNFQNAQFDELAMWTRKLQVNRTHNEVLYFLGGYQPEYAGIDPEHWLELLDNVNLHDSDQRQTAAAITSVIMRVEDEKARRLLANTELVLEMNKANGTSMFGWGNNFTRTNEQQRAYDRIKVQSETIERLISASIDLGVIGGLFMPRDLRKSFSVLSTATQPLASTHANIDGWKSVQLDPNEPGSPRLVRDIEDYALSFMTAADISYPESFLPFYDANRQEMVAHAITDSLAMSVTKMSLKRLKDYGSSLDISYHFANHPFSQNKVFEKYPESILIPTELVLVNETACSDLDLSLLTAIYDGYGRFGPTRRNPTSIRARKVKIDARVISVRTSFVDPTNVARNITGCGLDTEVMKYNPIRIVFQHFDHQTSRRKLLWHEDDLQTKIEQRKCVVWNPDIGVNGAWDGTHCTTVITEQSETVCECADFGTFTVMAELVEEPHLEPEPKWLAIIKYFGFVFSLICLAIMIAVIVMSYHLRDMFHTLRLNTAVSHFVALLIMVIAQNREICADRHNSIALSILQQIFFGAGTCFICFESFATFSAITMGIIGGKTWSYILLSYGIPLLNTGLSIFFFGDDYGKDPRCFTGWENETKMSFLAVLLGLCAISLILAIIIVLNIASPRTRRESILDQLVSQGNGLSIVVFLMALNWSFGYPALTRYPDKNMADFWPIFILLCSWFGVVIFIFLGVASMRFRMAVLIWFKPETWKRYRHYFDFDDEDSDNEGTQKNLAVVVKERANGQASLSNTQSSLTPVIEETGRLSSDQSDSSDTDNKA